MRPLLLTVKADDVDGQIGELRAMLGAATDAELAALLGMRRSAISQWRKRDHVPEKALFQASKIIANRSVAEKARGQLESLTTNQREMFTALAAKFIVAYAKGDTTKLLRWAGSFDELVISIARLVYTRSASNKKSISDNYEKLAGNDPFFEQDVLEALIHGES